MRLLTWVLGLLVCLLGLEFSFAERTGWEWFWFAALGTWFLVGLGVALAALIGKALAKGRLSPGLGTAPRVERPGSEQREA